MSRPLSDSTIKNYRAGFKTWELFCAENAINAQQLPPVETNLTAYKAWLNQRYKPGTVDNKLVALKYAIGQHEVVTTSIATVANDDMATTCAGVTDVIDTGTDSIATVAITTGDVATTRAAEVIKLWQETWPKIFNPRVPFPLAIGIADKLAKALPQLSSADIQLGLGEWCNRREYHLAILKSRHRWNLDCVPSGPISVGTRNRAFNVLKKLYRELGEECPLRSPQDKPPPKPRPERKSKPEIKHKKRKRKKIKPESIPQPPQERLPTTMAKAELTLKFNEVPTNAVITPQNITFEVQDNFLYHVTVRPKFWKKITEAAKQYPLWIAIMTGKIDKIEQNTIFLKEVGIAVFERKLKPEKPSVTAATT